MIKVNEMTNEELFEMIDKDFKYYENIYKYYINEIKKSGYNLTEHDCLTFLKTFFNQIKNGEVN